MAASPPLPAVSVTQTQPAQPASARHPASHSAALPAGNPGGRLKTQAGNTVATCFGLDCFLRADRPRRLRPAAVVAGAVAALQQVVFRAIAYNIVQQKLRRNLPQFTFRFPSDDNMQ